MIPLALEQHLNRHKTSVCCPISCILPTCTWPWQLSGKQLTFNSYKQAATTIARFHCTVCYPILFDRLSWCVLLLLHPDSLLYQSPQLSPQPPSLLTSSMMTLVCSWTTSTSKRYTHTHTHINQITTSYHYTSTNNVRICWSHTSNFLKISCNKCMYSIISVNRNCTGTEKIYVSDEK